MDVKTRVSVVVSAFVDHFFAGRGLELEYKIDFIAIPQAPVQYFVWNEQNTDIAGYILITVSQKKKSALISNTPSMVNEAAIWHTYVAPEYRRQGYASAMITAIKQNFDTIHCQALEPNFKRLLMKNGFIRDDSKSEKLKTFRWTK